MNDSVVLYFDGESMTIQLDGIEIPKNVFGCIDFAKLYRHLAKQEIERIKASQIRTFDDAICETIQNELKELDQKYNLIIESQFELIDGVKYNSRDLSETEKKNLTQNAFKRQMLTNAFALLKGATDRELYLISHWDKERFDRHALAIFAHSRLSQGIKSEKEIEEALSLDMQTLSKYWEDYISFRHDNDYIFDFLLRHKMLPKGGICNGFGFTGYYVQDGLQIPQQSFLREMHRIVEESADKKQAVYDVVIAAYCCNKISEPKFRMVQKEFDTIDLNKGKFSKVVADKIKELNKANYGGANWENVIELHKEDRRTPHICHYRFYDYYLRLKKIK